MAEIASVFTRFSQPTYTWKCKGEIAKITITSEAKKDVT